MRLQLDCVACLVRQALQAARFATSDEKTHEQVLRQVLEELLKADWSSTPPELAHHVHRVVRRVTGVYDPYREVKKRSNDHALKLYPSVKRIVDESSDPLETAVRVAIAGNIIDFGACEKPDVEAALNRVLKQDFAIFDYEEFRSAALNADTVLYFLDNAGEIVFDKLLLETLVNLRGEPYKRVTLVVKGGPIINDATLEDAKYVGLDKLPGVQFRFVSNGEEGTGPERSSPEVKGWIDEHDVTISKGQGNYEDLSEFSGCFFLLMVKCPVIARKIGVNVGDIVLMHG